MNDDSDPAAPSGPPPRACGPCSACCEFAGVDELAKPPDQRCAHQCQSGCAIYADRPPSCRAYTCLWQEGEFADGDRPDKIGLAFDLPAHVRNHPDYAGIHAICAYELWPGARDEPRAATLLLQLSRAMVVRLAAADQKTQLLGPRSSIQLLALRAAGRKN